MIIKWYDIFLDNKKIGTTELENSDAPMGVVYGRVTFDHIDSGYDFLKTYCLTNSILIITDYPEDKLNHASDLICGNNSTSCMVVWPVSNIVSLSIPIPIPDVGGIPYSNARRKSWSMYIASSSPFF